MFFAMASSCERIIVRAPFYRSAFARRNAPDNRTWSCHDLCVERIQSGSRQGGRLPGLQRQGRQDHLRTGWKGRQRRQRAAARDARGSHAPADDRGRIPEHRGLRAVHRRGGNPEHPSSAREFNQRLHLDLVRALGPEEMGKLRPMKITEDRDNKSMKPDLLLICPLFPATMAQLDVAYAVHRYYQATDKDAFIAGLADRITAAATAGHEGMSVALMSKFPKLKIISCFGVGVDGIDVPSARKLGIAVTNTPDVLTECVADNALALLLATLRRTVFNDKFVRAGNWRKGDAPLAEKVSGSRLGIIGLGRIGKAIARRAEAFGMKIGYHSRRRQPEVAYDYYNNVLDLARAAKILVLACPGGKETEH